MLSDAPTGTLYITAHPPGSPAYHYDDRTAVTLICQLSGGNPVAALSWRCKGQSLSGNNRSTASVAKSVLSLTMDSTYNGQQCLCTASHILLARSKTDSKAFTVYCRLHWIEYTELVWFCITYCFQGNIVYWKEYFMYQECSNVTLKGPPINKIYGKNQIYKTLHWVSLSHLSPKISFYMILSLLVAFQD